MSTWLESLAAGDEVMVDGRYGAPPSFYKVTRITPTQIVIGSQKYKRANGAGIGFDSWSTPILRAPTNEGRERAEDATLRKSIEHISKDPATSLQTLRSMFKASQP